jgi:hypothetical protein
LARRNFYCPCTESFSRVYGYTSVASDLVAPALNCTNEQEIIDQPRVLVIAIRRAREVGVHAGESPAGAVRQFSAEGRANWRRLTTHPPFPAIKTVALGVDPTGRERSGAVLRTDPLSDHYVAVPNNGYTVTFAPLHIYLHTICMTNTCN